MKKQKHLSAASCTAKYMGMSPKMEKNTPEQFIDYSQKTDVVKFINTRHKQYNEMRLYHRFSTGPGWNMIFETWCCHFSKMISPYCAVNFITSVFWEWLYNSFVGWLDRYTKHNK